MDFYTVGSKPGGVSICREIVILKFHLRFKGYNAFVNNREPQKGTCD